VDEENMDRLKTWLMLGAIVIEAAAIATIGTLYGMEVGQ
jgi:hypothetical protein